MSCMPDMTPSLAAAIAPHRSKIIKNGFLKEEKICYKMEYYTLYGKLSYSPQLPWIFPGTIRQNIIFGKPFQKELYKKVITACALSRVSTISIIFFIRTNFINRLRFYSPKLNTAYNIVRKKSNYLFNVSGFFYSLTDC